MGACHSAKKKQSSHQFCSLSPHRKHSERTIIETKSRLPVSYRSFLKLSFDSVSSNYKLRKVLGCGAYSEVRRCQHLPTGQERAIKRIPKKRCRPELFTEYKMLAEIDIMRSLDHPNIVRCYEFYQDKHDYYIVMEYCKGGALIDEIVRRKRFTEHDAAVVMRQLLSALTYCRAKGVTHRDLKPQNLLLQDKSKLTVKVADFGCGATSTRHLTGLYGTADYIAPEVFEDDYSASCDVWSAGIILFVLLTGKMPYPRAPKQGIQEYIRKHPFQVPYAKLSHVSVEARSLLASLLQVNPLLRLTPELALEHSWFQRMQSESQTRLAPIYQHLRKYCCQHKLKEAVRIFISSQLIEAQNDLAVAFQAADTNGDGRLSKDELLEAFQEVFGEAAAVAEVEQLMAAVDSDQSGFIDYSEFVQASLHEAVFGNEVLLRHAFNQFDLDGDGVITATEVRTVLQGSFLAKEEVWTELIQEGDTNGDSVIDFEEFVAMMKA